MTRAGRRPSEQVRNPRIAAASRPGRTRPRPAAGLPPRAGPRAAGRPALRRWRRPGPRRRPAGRAARPAARQLAFDPTSVATTARPAAMYSSSAFDIPSECDGSTATSTSAGTPARPPPNRADEPVTESEFVCNRSSSARVRRRRRPRTPLREAADRRAAARMSPSMFFTGRRFATQPTRTTGCTVRRGNRQTGRDRPRCRSPPRTPAVPRRLRAGPAARDSEFVSDTSTSGLTRRSRRRCLRVSQ